MKKKKFLLLSLVVAVLLALLAGGTVLGQEPEEPAEGLPPPPAATVEPAEFPDEVDQGSEGRVEAGGEVGALAQPPYTMNYQGYLTDGSGNPLDGTYDLTFSLYDDATVGNQEWGPEPHNGVQITNGLFHVVLGESVDLYPNDFDEALFLEVEVSGTALATRQPVRTVAYAFGLAPGAEVQGDPEGSSYALSVNNTGNASNDRGLYVRGQQYGIYAEEVSAVSGVDVGIYSPDFVQARGYKSNDDSYWWYDANHMESEDELASTGGFNILNRYQGGVRLDCWDTGSDWFVLPLDVPGVLLGQEVRVEEARVYYRTTNAATFIDTTYVYKCTDPSTTEQIAYLSTNQDSTTAISYEVPINALSNYTLTASSGNLVALFDLECGHSDHNIYISGVRLQLGHTD